jgi:hypothetical protein
VPQEPQDEPGSRPDDLGIWAPPTPAHCLRCGSKQQEHENFCRVCGYNSDSRSHVEGAAEAAFQGHENVSPMPVHDPRPPAYAPRPPPFGGGGSEQTPPVSQTWASGQPPAKKTPLLIAALVILLLVVGGMGYLLTRHQSTPKGTSPTSAPAASAGGTSSTPSRSGAVPTTPNTDLSALSVTPQICDSDFSPLDCSYRFKLVGQDLVLASASEDVYARLALVGPAYVTDAAGGRWTLVRVRVSAFHGSVSVDPTEFLLGSGDSSGTPATTAPVPGVTDQVTGHVSVSAGSGFIKTLAFRDQPGSNSTIAWLRSSGEPAATWTVPG